MRYGYNGCKLRQTSVNHSDIKSNDYSSECRETITWRVKCNNYPLIQRQKPLTSTVPVVVRQRQIDV